MEKSLANAAGDSSYYPVAAFACVISLCIYKLSDFASRKLLRSFALSLSEGEMAEWNTRVVSSVHALVVSATSLYSQLFDDDMHTHLLWWDAPLVRASCAVVIGYLTFDFITIMVYHKHLGETGYYFHHGVSIYAYYYPVTYDVMPYFANFRLLAEISTPFVNMRWFRAVMRADKTSLPARLNGVVMLITFFFFRVLAIPVYWHKVYIVYHMPRFSSLGIVPVVLVITCVVLDSLNLYWFYKIVRGVVRMLPELFGKNVDKSGSGDQEKKEMKRVKSG